MRNRGLLAAGLTLGMALASAGIATAHAPGVADGHIPANTNYGFEPVGHSALEGVQDGRYTDVWAHEETAYIGSFQNPDCTEDGVFIADISNPADPQYIGKIDTPVSTRVNDVKVTDVGDMDVLIFSHELCSTTQFAVADSAAAAKGIERGKPHSGGTVVQDYNDGISLYDVTDPARPRALKKGFLKTDVHNTFPWTTDDGRTFLLAVDDFATDDVIVVEITNPKSPKVQAVTGIQTWIDEGLFDIETSELFLGTFATPLLHDVWVEEHADGWRGVLSYWDAGFVTIDLDDPSNPTFIDDSDYLDQDPILAEERAAFGGRPEGNAHAAVFGGEDDEFIFGGDEDFDANAVTVTQGEIAIAANTGSDTPAPSQDGLSGDLRFVGLACDPADVPPAGAPTEIALIERGACAFTTKASTITGKGYAAGIVFNSEPNGCQAGIGMLVEGTVPMVSVSRGEGLSLAGLDCATDPASVPAIGDLFAETSLASSFVGWGYFWAVNNSGSPVDVSGTPSSKDGTTSVGEMGTMGYYAPAEIADPLLATDAGDLTMHNLETDIVEGARDRSFISWYSLGMRAVEYREGHFHDNSNGEGSYSWNVHEVGRWIAGADDPFVMGAATNAGLDPVDLEGSNFWGITQTEIDGTRYILGSDRNTGLWIFTYDCGDAGDPSGPLYCGDANQG